MIYTADVVVPITYPPIREGAVLVKEGLIVAVGEKGKLISEHQGEDVLAFENAILMPGLVNLHGHFECASFDYLAEPAPFSKWLGDIIKASREMQRDDWLRAAREGVKRSLEAGITCAADITRTGAGLQAAVEAGMPALIYFEVVGVDDSGLLEAVVDILEKIKGSEIIAGTGDIRLGLSPHSPYTLSSSALKVCSEISREYELSLSIHLAETRDEVELIRDGSGPLASTISERLKLDVIENGGSGKTPAKFLDDFGLINGSLVAAHGVWLSDEDITLLKERGAAVAVCPTSNELLGVGEAPVKKFIDRGLSFGIGTDSLASNPEFDLFLEMRKVRALIDKQAWAQKGTETSLSSKSLVEMITINAAEILGFDDELGSIEPGKRADFAVINYDKNLDTDPYDYLAENASKPLIINTILGGEVVYSR